MTTVTALDMHTRIRSRQARIAVVGCGYVGLPLSMAFADAGFAVLGIETNESRVDSLRRGESYIMDVRAETVRTHVTSGKFQPTSDYSALRDADVIFVSVPTPFDRAKQPDLGYIVAAAEGIASQLRRGQLVILESTTFPGTTDEVLRPILEQSGLRAGTDFYLAFSPERIDPGSKTHQIGNTPKVVGGVDPESIALAALVLEQVVTNGGVHRVSSARAAEMTKLLENIFRAVNIALVNELAMLCDRMGIDVWEVIEAAATKPYGFMPFYPGPGVGGHCIPVDPYYLSWKAREYDFSTKFIEIAAETNLQMPFFTVDKLRRELHDRGKNLDEALVLVLGAAYKSDVDDARNSASIRVIEILLREGADVRYHDPFVPRITVGQRIHGDGERGQELVSVPLEESLVRRADAVVVLVGHSTIDYGWLVERAALVFDVVNAARNVHGTQGKVVRL